MNTAELYNLAENRNIEIYKFNDIPYVSMCSQVDGTCAIAITDTMLKCPKLEKVCLAHELGHCETACFYNRNNPLDIIGRHEYRANKWAVNHIIGEKAFNHALSQGYTEIWQLAEYFDVTEDFIKKAATYYNIYG